MAEEIQSKAQIVKNLIKQTTEAMALGEIMLDYETSNPWKDGDDIKKKAEHKMKIEKLKLKDKDNAEFLGFLKRYLNKIEQNDGEEN